MGKHKQSDDSDSDDSPHKKLKPTSTIGEDNINDADQQIDDSTDGDSDTGDSDDEDMEDSLNLNDADTARIMALEESLSNNSKSYEAHLQVFRAFSTCAHLYIVHICIVRRKHLVAVC
jgi:hypothetical protein